MNVILRLKKALGIFTHYYVKVDPSKLGHFGYRASIGVPADLKCPKNIYLYEHARIGRRSTIMTMGDSKFISITIYPPVLNVVISVIIYNKSLFLFRVEFIVLRKNERLINP